MIYGNVVFLMGLSLNRYTRTLNSSQGLSVWCWQPLALGLSVARVVCCGWAKGGHSASLYSNHGLPLWAGGGLGK